MYPADPAIESVPRLSPVTRAANAPMCSIADRPKPSIDQRENLSCHKTRELLRRIRYRTVPRKLVGAVGSSIVDSNNNQRRHSLLRDQVCHGFVQVQLVWKWLGRATVKKELPIKHVQDRIPL